jgi:hypothetical protein
LQNLPVVTSDRFIPDNDHHPPIALQARQELAQGSFNAALNPIPDDGALTNFFANGYAKKRPLRHLAKPKGYQMEVGRSFTRSQLIDSVKIYAAFEPIGFGQGHDVPQAAP